MSINNRNYKGGTIRFSRNDKTVRMSISGETPGGKTVVSNFDFPAEFAAYSLEQWARELRAFWSDERQLKVDQHQIEIERGDRIFGDGRPGVKPWGLTIEERRGGQDNGRRLD